MINANDKSMLLSSLLFVLLFLLPAGCIDNAGHADEQQQTKANPRESIESFKIKTDKEVYHSKELMEIFVEIESKSDLEGLQIVVYGIIEAGKPRMHSLFSVNLTQGSNLIRYNYELPSCNTCSGIRAGEHEFFAELYMDNEIMNQTAVKVGIEQ